jgi:hypothetical protein
MHYTTQRFWRCYETLPEEAQKTADEAYQLLKTAPSHPSLHFKKVGKGYWSVRVGLKYRALGVEVTAGISWFWIGSHAEYDKLIGKL